MLLQMRKAATVVMVPTGNLRDSGVSSPLLEQGKVVDWIDPWPGEHQSANVKYRNIILQSRDCIE